MTTSSGTNVLGEVGILVNAEPTFEMKTRFSDTLNTLLQEKANNSRILTRDKNCSFIDDVTEDKASFCNKYAGYVPGLKYTFGHTYGYDESRLFKSQHPTFRQGKHTEKLTPYQSSLREPQSVENVCIERNVGHQKLSKTEDQQRRVQWTDAEAKQQQQHHGMETVETTELQEPLKNASIQCSLEEIWTKDEEREGLRSAATQWSDQETHRKKKYSAATQWSPADFSPLKTIPGYTGHLPGRHFVNPGKTFCQEMDALLTNFQPKSAAVVPISRHNFTSALQQITNNKPEGKNDPYFDNRPPSTYLNNYPIPGYQGFVPRVRTSTSSLGIRYIKAVEKSLNALHEQNLAKRSEEDEYNEETANSPKKLLDRRPLHTPRHRPHPRQQPSDEDDWRMVYKRPPSTYLDSSKTYIPGYKGFIPHLRGSPNAVGVRYSKAALRCVEASHRETDKQENTETGNYDKPQSDPSQEESKDEDIPPPEQKEEELENDDQIQDYGDAGSDSDNGIEDEFNKSNSTENNRLQRKMSHERPYRKQHSDYLRERKPSTYRSDERHPIPGYKGFVPRLRDSPTTLGLRYTKAALKTLEDIHRMQQRTHER